VNSARVSNASLSVTPLSRLLRYVPATWLGDLTNAQVRAEIVSSLYTNRAMTVLMNIGMCIAYYFAYDFVRSDAGLLCAMAVFCGSPLWQYLVELSVKKDTVKTSLSDTASMHYLASSIFSSIVLALAMTYMLVTFLVQDPRGLNSPAVIGTLFYYFAAIVKNISVRMMCVIYSVIVLTPMALYFLWQADTPNVIVGMLVIFLQMVVIFFSKTMSQLITSRIKLNQEVTSLAQRLTIERDRADSANAAKSRFFTAASHDARQPLQAIGLLYDGIVSSTHLNSADRKVIEKIGANLHSIRNLFNRVLDISRIETGSIEPHYQAVPLQNLFNALDAQMGEFAASKNLWLRFAPTQAVVWHDPDLLERMASNCVHNALKFTQQGGVWVGYRVTRGVLEIRDSGIGIAPNEQTQIFEEFYQLDNSARNRADGSGLGLGLSIVKRLAFLSDTKIGIRSALGKGSVFSMHLKPVGKPVTGAAGVTSQSSPELQLTSLLGHSILLVEDDDELRQLFKQRLSTLGAEVFDCEGVDQVMDKLPLASFSALITDYRLGSGASGIDVANLARQTMGNTLPVIMITGDTSELALKEMAEQPHTWVLHKPVTINQLALILQENKPLAQ
jgi:two-component system, sensor histidine kinase